MIRLCLETEARSVSEGTTVSIYRNSLAYASGFHRIAIVAKQSLVAAHQ
jgi:hypothetical protein